MTVKDTPEPFQGDGVIFESSLSKGRPLAVIWINDKEVFHGEPEVSKDGTSITVRGPFSLEFDDVPPVRTRVHDWRKVQATPTYLKVIIMICTLSVLFSLLQMMS